MGLLVICAFAVTGEQRGPLQVRPRPARDEAQAGGRPVPETPGAAAGQDKRTGAPACPPGYILKPAPRGEERPPRLRRGKPQTRDEAEPEPALECVQVEALSPSPDRVSGDLRRDLDPLLTRVRGNTYAFARTLPDFTCEQWTEREFSQTTPARWVREDRITAEVFYVDGKEEYRNFRRNGKKMEAPPERTGTWSTGEFGTLLLDLFSPATQAKFRYRRESEIDGVKAKVYDYMVEQENSHWRVDYEGRFLYPAYEGSLWVDPESFRVLRVEMSARNIPPDYPLDVIEMAIDYGPVEIGGKQYLLATHAANLSCQRGTPFCNRNEIRFRNYRKFTVESRITATDSPAPAGGQPPPR